MGFYHTCTLIVECVLKNHFHEQQKTEIRIQQNAVSCSVMGYQIKVPILTLFN